MKMEHMDMPWKCVHSTEQNGAKAWDVITDQEELPWYVLRVTEYLPGDVSGELTAEAICAEHNAALAARKGSK